MSPADHLASLPQPTARLVQIALRELGHYHGTTEGLPGPKTLAGYEKYLLSLENPTDGTQALGSLVASLAEGELHVREIPKDSNMGLRVEKYQRATWLDGTGWAYCAAFVCWCVLHAGRRIPLSFPRPRTPAAYGLEKWGEENGLDVVYEPGAGEIERGDILIFKWSHTGFATAADENGRVKTVEGNTSPGSTNNEGGGVYRRDRELSGIRSRVRLKLK